MMPDHPFDPERPSAIMTPYHSSQPRSMRRRAKSLRLLGVLAAFIATFNVAAQTPLDLGMQAMTHEQYEQAATHFREHKARVDSHPHAQHSQIGATATLRLIEALDLSGQLDERDSVVAELLGWYPTYFRQIESGATTQDDLDSFVRALSYRTRSLLNTGPLRGERLWQARRANIYAELLVTLHPEMTVASALHVYLAAIPLDGDAPVMHEASLRQAIHASRPFAQFSDLRATLTHELEALRSEAGHSANHSARHHITVAERVRSMQATPDQVEEARQDVALAVHQLMLGTDDAARRNATLNAGNGYWVLRAALGPRDIDVIIAGRFAAQTAVADDRPEEAIAICDELLRHKDEALAQLQSDVENLNTSTLRKAAVPPTSRLHLFTAEARFSQRDWSGTFASANEALRQLDQQPEADRHGAARLGALSLLADSAHLSNDPERLTDAYRYRLAQLDVMLDRDPGCTDQNLIVADRLMALPDKSAWQSRSRQTLQRLLTMCLNTPPSWLP